jgi:hypothetical protein
MITTIAGHEDDGSGAKFFQQAKTLADRAGAKLESGRNRFKGDRFFGDEQKAVDGTQRFRGAEAAHEVNEERNDVALY